MPMNRPVLHPWWRLVSLLGVATALLLMHTVTVAIDSHSTGGPTVAVAATSHHAAATTKVGGAGSSPVVAAAPHASGNIDHNQLGHHGLSGMCQFDGAGTAAVCVGVLLLAVAVWRRRPSWLHRLPEPSPLLWPRRSRANSVRPRALSELSVLRL